MKYNKENLTKKCYFTCKNALQKIIQIIKIAITQNVEKIYVMNVAINSKLKCFVILNVKLNLKMNEKHIFIKSIILINSTFHIQRNKT